MKIVILDGYTENPGDLSWEGFERLGELTIYDRTPVQDKREIQNRIGSAEIVITNKTPLTREILDVVSVEPIREDNPLLTAKNCLITPHIAWASKESRQRLMDTAVGNLEAFLAGRPVNVVNLPIE